MSPRSALLVLIVLALSAAAQARTRLGATLELGPELDSNATRVETESGSSARVMSALTRFVASGRLQLRAWDRHAFALSYGGAGKLFHDGDAREADELLHHADLSWAWASPVGVLTLAGSYYEAFQRQSLWDFRAGQGVARLVTQLGSHLRPWVELGYRGLAWKPIEDYRFDGFVGGLGLRALLSSGAGPDAVEWELTLAYQAALRHFALEAAGVPVRTCGSDECLDGKGIDRQDLNHLLRLEVVYLGHAEARFWYSAELNQSNSYGETYARHVVGLKYTTPLVWSLFMTIKAVLQVNQLSDPFVKSAVANQNPQSTDDENRSRLELQLARDVTAWLSIYVRYGLYVSESISFEDLPQEQALPGFQRHTLFGGVRINVGS